MKSFTEYTSIKDCVEQNQDKKKPEAYCGCLKRTTERAIKMEKLNTLHERQLSRESFSETMSLSDKQKIKDIMKDSSSIFEIDEKLSKTGFKTRLAQTSGGYAIIVQKGNNKVAIGTPRQFEDDEYEVKIGPYVMGDYGESTSTNKSERVHKEAAPPEQKRINGKRQGLTVRESLKENSMDDFMTSYGRELNTVARNFNVSVNKAGKWFQTTKKDVDKIADGLVSKLSRYDSNIVKWIDSVIGSGRARLTARDIANKAIENYNRNGTEPRMVIDALEEAIDYMDRYFRESAPQSKLEQVTGSRLILAKQAVRNQKKRGLTVDSAADYISNLFNIDEKEAKEIAKSVFGESAPQSKLERVHKEKLDRQDIKEILSKISREWEHEKNPRGPFSNRMQVTLVNYVKASAIAFDDNAVTTTGKPKWNADNDEWEVGRKMHTDTKYPKDWYDLIYEIQNYTRSIDSMKESAPQSKLERVHDKVTLRESKYKVGDQFKSKRRKGVRLNILKKVPGGYEVRIFDGHHVVGDVEKSEKDLELDFIKESSPQSKLERVHKERTMKESTLTVWVPQNQTQEFEQKASKDFDWYRKTKFGGGNTYYFDEQNPDALERALDRMMPNVSMRFETESAPQSKLERVHESVCKEYSTWKEPGGQYPYRLEDKSRDLEIIGIESLQENALLNAELRKLNDKSYALEIKNIADLKMSYKYDFEQRPKRSDFGDVTDVQWRKIQEDRAAIKKILQNSRKFESLQEAVKKYSIPVLNPQAAKKDFVKIGANILSSKAGPDGASEIVFTLDDSKIPLFQKWLNKNYDGEKASGFQESLKEQWDDATKIARAFARDNGKNAEDDDLEDWLDMYAQDKRIHDGISQSELNDLVKALKSQGFSKITGRGIRTESLQKSSEPVIGEAQIKVLKSNKSRIVSMANSLGRLYKQKVKGASVTQHSTIEFGGRFLPNILVGMEASAQTISEPFITFLLRDEPSFSPEPKWLVQVKYSVPSHIDSIHIDRKFSDVTGAITFLEKYHPVLLKKLEGYTKKESLKELKKGDRVHTPAGFMKVVEIDGNEVIVQGKSPNDRYAFDKKEVQKEMMNMNKLERLHKELNSDGIKRLNGITSMRDQDMLFRAVRALHKTALDDGFSKEDSRQYIINLIKTMTT